jgi:hypothetical protein
MAGFYYPEAEDTAKEVCNARLPGEREREREREREDLVGSHGRWKRPCLQPNPDGDQVVP